MTNLRTAIQKAIADICAARLCEMNSMSSRREVLRLMIQATDTLRAALEQPDVPEADCGNMEPVAWRTFDGEGGYDYRTYDGNENYRDEWDRRNQNHKGWVEPLFTHPPRREWRGLTEEEVNDCIKYPGRSLFARDGTTSQRIARAIEAALKEKNK